MPICPICKKELKVITEKHTKVHGMSSKEYFSLYPDTKVFVAFTNPKFIGRTQKHFTTKEMISLYAEIIKQKTTYEKLQEKTQRNIVLLYNDKYSRKEYSMSMTIYYSVMEILQKTVSENIETLLTNYR